MTQTVRVEQMARIRSIKPEFWDSPSTAKAGPWARLLFIAMWNWADDYGRGTANLKELEGFAFPNDDSFTDRSGNTVNFRELVAEVSECFGVVFYEADNRPYYYIPTWDEHQRNERRSKQSKYPDPPGFVQVSDDVADMHGISATQERICTVDPKSSGPGTGEQGNRGTGEQVGGRKKPSVPLPESWSPTVEHRERAEAKGMDVSVLAEEMRNWAESKDERKVNWNAAFTNWIIRAEPKPSNALKVRPPSGRLWQE